MGLKESYAEITPSKKGMFKSDQNGIERIFNLESQECVSVGFKSDQNGIERTETYKKTLIKTVCSNQTKMGLKGLRVLVFKKF